jgi:hypothetical protein
LNAPLVLQLAQVGKVDSFNHIGYKAKIVREQAGFEVDRNVEKLGVVMSHTTIVLRKKSKDRKHV